MLAVDSNTTPGGINNGWCVGVRAGFAPSTATWEHTTVYTSSSRAIEAAPDQGVTQVPRSTVAEVPSLKLLLTREWRRLVSRPYAHKMRKGRKIAPVSGSSRSRWKFLVIFLTSLFWGWYVNTRGMVVCSSDASTCSGIRSSRGDD